MASARRNLFSSPNAFIISGDLSNTVWFTRSDLPFYSEQYCGEYSGAMTLSRNHLDSLSETYASPLYIIKHRTVTQFSEIDSISNILTLQNFSCLFLFNDKQNGGHCRWVIVEYDEVPRHRLRVDPLIHTCQGVQDTVGICTDASVRPQIFQV